MIGCLIDVSGSMRQALEPEGRDEPVTERLQAVVRAVLRLAQTEYGRDPGAQMFVGAFGLKSKYPPVLDLCSVVEALIDGSEGGQNGHDLLIALANEEHLGHITEYIRSKLTLNEALTIHSHLRRHPEDIAEFVNAIPSAEQLENNRRTARNAGAGGGVGAAALIGLLGGGVVGGVLGGLVGAAGGGSSASYAEDYGVEHSEVMQMAHRICDEWLQEFSTLTPRPVADVVALLQRLQEYSAARAGDEEEHPSQSNSLLDLLRRYIYALTPMRDALTAALSCFTGHPVVGAQALVLFSDGNSTDGDPVPLAGEFHRANITVATIYLTSDKSVPRRRLHDRPVQSWNAGQRALFSMASRVAGDRHPVPVLASMGWGVPSSGECALYATVCSTVVVEEFCSMLLSSRFGSTDALLDIGHRVLLDTYVNDHYVRTCQNPSDQGHFETCYAHATAAVLHMALHRIVGRQGGYSTIKELRDKILDKRNFPPHEGGRPTNQVLETAVTWYRPLKFREVDEDGARQAVLHRRPVLATFRLSAPGWETFTSHFTSRATSCSTLSRADMEAERLSPPVAGHAVVLVRCHPRSLTFLNSWGPGWGDNGSFRVENASVLEVEYAQGGSPVRFYDIFWLEQDLSLVEQEAYYQEVELNLHQHITQHHPSILKLHSRCPNCQDSAPISQYTGTVRCAECPTCEQWFEPQPGHLMDALYAGVNPSSGA